MSVKSAGHKMSEPERVTGMNMDRVGSVMLSACSILCVALLLFPLIASAAPASTEDRSLVEKKLTSFIKEFYQEDTDIQVKFNNIPESLKGKAKVRGINFSKVPDAQGDGVCLVEFDMKESRERNAYVAFKVYKKRQLFVLKQGGKRGNVVTDADVAEKEAFLTGMTAYPASRGEVIGKRLRRDLPAGTVLTPQAIEDPILIQTGEVVHIIAENPRLVIHTNGKALDRGRMGETIRVKNLNSGKEILGKVTGGNTVTVEF